jgi:hypothetical protein
MVGGVGGVVAGELWRQQRVARRLSPRFAARWMELGALERYAFGRELRRGRALDDPADAAMGAEVASALGRDVTRRWILVIGGVLGLAFLALAVVAAGFEKFALAGVELAIAAILLGVAALQPRARTKLAAAEQANRALADGS